MRNTGFSDAEIERALILNRRVNGYYRSGQGRARLLAELHSVQDEEWYAAAVDFGLLPWPDDVTEPDDPQTIAHVQQWDFTLLTPLAEFDGPVLAAFGLQDRAVPPRAGADTIEAALADAGNDHRILRYPQAGHVILVWLTGERTCGLGIPRRGTRLATSMSRMARGQGAGVTMTPTRATNPDHDPGCQGIRWVPGRVVSGVRAREGR